MPSNCRSSSSTRCSSSSRPATTALCSEACAPICAPRGRVAKYASDSPGATRAAGPSTRTWRPSGSQEKSSAACGFASSSRPLRLVKCVWKTSPDASNRFNSTIRTDGAPPAEAVARAIASGARTTARASSNQRSNCTQRIRVEVAPSQRPFALVHDGKRSRGPLRESRATLPRQPRCPCPATRPPSQVLHRQNGKEPQIRAEPLWARAGCEPDSPSGPRTLRPCREAAPSASRGCGAPRPTDDDTIYWWRTR